MNKGKHLTLDERKQIETLLNRKHSFKSIGRELSRDCTTIAKEVSAHVIFKRTAIRGVTCNNCKHRFQCTQHHLCRDCATPRQSKKCHFCKLCNFVCKKYEADICPTLEKAPHVCNSCPKRFASCTLEKHLYDAISAHKEYTDTLSESRTGLTLSEDDISHLNEIISPLLRKKQSLHHICVNHRDSIMISESREIRMLQTEVFEIIIVTTDSAAFIHFKGFLFSTSGVPDLSWEIYIWLICFILTFYTKNCNINKLLCRIFLNALTIVLIQDEILTFNVIFA